MPGADVFMVGDVIIRPLGSVFTPAASRFKVSVFGFLPVATMISFTSTLSFHLCVRTSNVFPLAVFLTALTLALR